MVVILNDELYHHGILGQRWGKRNGPPYPLKASDHSASEKKAGWKKSLEKESPKTIDLSKTEEKGKKAAVDALEKFNNKNFRSPKEILHLSDADYAKAAKLAKIAGIGVASGAGIIALGCLINANGGFEDFSALDDIDPRDYVSDGYNADGTRPKGFFDLDDSLFQNPYNDDYIGKKAASDGFGEIGPEVIQDAIANPINNQNFDYDALCKHVRLEYVDYDSERLLSCWSASQAIYLSALTGRDFISKSFLNAVDFNEFDKLYYKHPDIFDAFGRKTSDYVGFSGIKGARTGLDDTYSLAENILKKVSSSNNLTPDGTRTIGFINAEYHGSGLPHQMNFEIFYNALDNSKQLIIKDGFFGHSFPLGKMLSDGSIHLDKKEMERFSGELMSYNRETVRFYAPSLNDVNPETVSKVVLGKT